MRSAPTPPDEAERLATLERYAVLDTPPEAAFDGIARVAMALLDAPIGLISLVDRQRQWFKASYGVELRQTARDIAFCPHVIHSRLPLSVPDTRADVRFDGNPLVTGRPNLRAYFGVPLLAPDGTIPGTLDVLDTRPRPDVSQAQLERLADLADCVITQLEYRLARACIDALEPDLELNRRMLDAVYARTGIGAALTDPGGRIVRANPRLARWIGSDERALSGRYLRHWLESAATPGTARDARLRQPDGGRRAVRDSAERLAPGDGRAYVLHLLTELTPEESGGHPA